MILTRLRGERGSITIGLAMLLPMIFTVGSLSWVLNRTAFAATAVDAAAYASARAASQSRDAPTAISRAVSSANTTLAAQDLHCSDIDIDVDAEDFDLPPGTPGNVTVRIVCTVDMSDVAMPGMPGSRVVWAMYTSPIDRYRARE